MGWAVGFMAEVGVFGVVHVCEVLLLVGLKDHTFVGCVWVRAEEGSEVDV